MANEILKLDDELRWGAILGVLQSDSDKLRMGLRKVLMEVHAGRKRLEQELIAEKVIPEKDGRYLRYYQLEALLGGLDMSLQGIDGVLTSVIMEMLRGIQ